MITRGRLLDRIRTAIAGSLAVKVVLGEDTNFSIADIKRATRLAEKLVFYYGMFKGWDSDRREYGLHVHTNLVACTGMYECIYRGM